MKDPTSERKLDHIRVIREDPKVDRQKYFFDDVQLIHRALPELDLQEVDPSTTFMGKKLSFPLLISCMTGGEDDLLLKVNRNLARAAETCGVAMGAGSQRVMFTSPAARKSFELRAFAPTTLLFSNLGAVQLNYGFGLDQCREAVEVTGADALYFHLNPLQEAVQPEGDTNFSGLVDRIGEVAGQLDVPVVLKEVGAGISRADVEAILDRGIRFIDVAGRGGTSWSRIEHQRQPDDTHTLGLTFQDWGIPTPTALEQLKPCRERLTLVASGGIRSGLDMAKAMVLGASLCGIASPFLQPAMMSPEAVVEVIEKLRREFVTAMFLLGTGRIEDLFANDSLRLYPGPGSTVTS